MASQAIDGRGAGTIASLERQAGAPTSRGSTDLEGLRMLVDDSAVGPNFNGNVGAARSFTTWGQAFGVDRHLGASQRLASTTTTGGGVAAGLDAVLGYGLSGGLAIGYSNPQEKADALLAKASGDTTFGGGYLRYGRGDWFAGATAAYGSTDLTLRRSVTVGALSYAPIGAVSAETRGTSLVGGYRFTLADGSRLDPLVTLDYVRDHQGACAETNGSAAELRYDAERMEQFTATVGARWSKTFTAHGWRVTPDASLAAAFAAGDLGLDTSATFLNAPTGTGGFRVLGAKTPPNWGGLGAGLKLAPLGSQVDVRLDYQGDYASGFTDHRIGATIAYRW